MIRNALIIGGASFVLMLGSFAGVAALAGPVIMKEGWTIPINRESSFGRTHTSVGARTPSPDVSRELAWSGESLTVELPLDVTYIQGPAAKVEITGPKAYVDRLRLENGRLSLIDDGDNREEEGALTIDHNGIRLQSNSSRVKIIVTAPKVSRFQLDGSGDLEIQSYDQPTLTLAINGSGDATASGRVAVLSLSAAGSGEAQLEDLAAKNADLTISGSGNAVVTARNVVTIALSGSGDVSLQAQPANLTANTSGSGTVQHDY
jgi:hypothetical protein